MARYLKLLSFVFFTLQVSPSLASDVENCEARLTPVERIYLKLLRSAAVDGLLGPSAQARLTSGEIIDPLAGIVLPAPAMHLQRALAGIFPQVSASQTLQNQLRTIASTRSEDQIQKAAARLATHDVFDPEQVEKFATGLNNSATDFFWFNDSRSRVRLAIQQRQGLVFRVMDPVTGLLVEKTPEVILAQSDLPQSRFFVREGRLMVVYERTKDRELALYDVLENSYVVAPEELQAEELRVIETGAERYVLAIAPSGFEVFRVGETLEHVQTVRAKYKLSNFAAFVDPLGHLQVVARDDKNVYLFEPQAGVEAVRTWTCGKSDSGQWITNLVAAPAADGEVVAAAISQDDAGIARLHLLREHRAEQPALTVIGESKDRTLPLRLHKKADRGLLLAVLEGDQISVLDPLAERPESDRTVLLRGKIFSPDWLTEPSGNFLALTERLDSDSAFKRRIFEVESPQNRRQVAEFDDNAIGGERHLRLANGQWLYVANTYARSLVTDGIHQFSSLTARTHVLYNSQPHEVLPGQFFVALNSGLYDRHNLRLLRITHSAGERAANAPAVSDGN